MVWSAVFVSIPVLCAGVTLWLLWRQDRPWKGIGHFSGLLSLSVLAGVVAFFVLVPLIVMLLWGLS